VSNARLKRSTAHTTALALGCAVLLLSLTSHAQNNRFDIVIAGARVVDGSGGAWFYADVGIRGDTIAAVGSLANADAALSVDATGLIVAPGFIDVHSHGAGGGPFYPGPGGLFDVPTAENYLREGVTTILEGADGYSPLPVAPFLDRIARTPISINFATLAGQGSIRQQVVGLANRRATVQEIERMKALAEQAMKDGAFGLSTGLFYVPGSYTPTEEIIELAAVVGRLGGIHTSHMRDEAAKVLDSVREIIRIGEEGHLPTQITHHKIIGTQNWGRSRETLALVEEARARGVDVTLDQYPYTASSTGLYSLVPQWALEGGHEALRKRLATPADREKIKAGIVQSIRFDRGGGDPKNVAIVGCAVDATIAGKTLTDLTRVRNVEPTIENAADTVMQLEARDECSAVFHAMSEEDVRRIMASPQTMIGSDGIIPVFGQGAPHPRSYGTFARILAVYVRETKLLTLEDAVRKMSGFPAARLKLWDRGLLRPGSKADLVIFDPATIADRAQFDKPHQYSTGVRDVVINGRFALRNGVVSAERPGRVLYGPAH
jgi:dihydroorotase/N-acyl-D-amino-acid deacylase